MNKLCVFFVNGISGGTATLSYRIGKRFKSLGYDVVYLCPMNNDAFNVRLLTEAGIEVEILSQSKWKYFMGEKKSNYEEAIFWLYAYELFDMVDDIRCEYTTIGCKVKVHLYAVHEHCLIRGGADCSGIKLYITKVFNSLNRSYINTIYNNEELIILDHQTCKLTEQKLNLNLSRKDIILPLPYDFHTNESRKIQKKDNIISTMARIDFPFKGYIIGLVRMFPHIYNCVKCDLWIIGDGKDMNVLKKEIEQVPEPIRNHIRLFGNVEYSEAKRLVSKTKVFVGMGTALLDAESVFVPSIGVQAYTMQCNGKGYFSENLYDLGYLHDAKHLYGISELILKTLILKDEEYNSMVTQGYLKVKEMYGMDSFILRASQFSNKGYSYNGFKKIGFYINRYFGMINNYLVKGRCI